MLAVLFAVAAFVALMALTLAVVHPDASILTTRFGDQQNQHAKTALYVVGFAVVLPVAGLLGVRVADGVAAGPNGRALGGLSAAMAAALAGLVVLVKVSTLLPWGDGLRVVFAAIALWGLAAALVLAHARRRAWEALRPLEGHGAVLGVAAGGVAFAAVLCFTHLSALELVGLVTAMAAIGRCLALLQDREVPRLRRRWGLAVDCLALVLIALAVPDLVVFTTSGAPPNVFFPPGIIQFHHDFLLGPTNQVLHGGTLLVDSPVSQYGVGSVYFLAAWFHLVPIGYGTYGLLDGILTGAFFAAGYAVLRVAGTPRLLAVPALGVGVVALVYALDYPVGALPQQGPLRFGLPMALILASAVAVRWPQRSRLAGGAALALVGLSSVWALEAFVYSGMTLAAVLLARAHLRPAGERAAWFVRQAALGFVACLAAHAGLALATLAASGRLPDWGQYFGYLRVFLGGGKAGELTYGFEPWSPGLVVAAALGASAAAVVLLARRRSDLVARNPATLVTLTGLTAYGIALLSYTENRSSTYLLPYVALPALLAAVLWLTLVLRSPVTAPRIVRAGCLVFVLGLGIVLVLSALPVGDRFSRSALAHTRPGGGLRSALVRLRDPPPIDPRAPAGQELLDRYLPGQRRVLILLPKSPELAVEILMRSDRANRLPVGNPVEESFVPSVWTPPLRRAIARLEPGERILVDRATLADLAALQKRRGFDPLADPQIGTDPLEEWIGLELLRRFGLHGIATGPEGFIVAELTRRR